MSQEPINELAGLIHVYEERIESLSSRYARRNRWLEACTYLIQVVLFLLDLVYLILHNVLNDKLWWSLVIEFAVCFIAAVLSSIKSPHRVEDDLRTKLAFLKKAEKIPGAKVYDEYVLSKAQSYLTEIELMTPASLRLI